MFEHVVSQNEFAFGASTVKVHSCQTPQYPNHVVTRSGEYSSRVLFRVAQVSPYPAIRILDLSILDRVGASVVEFIWKQSICSTSVAQHGWSEVCKWNIFKNSWHLLPVQTVQNHQKGSRCVQNHESLMTF